MSYLFPILAAIIWGANTIVTKLSAEVLSPIEISFYRWLLAVVVLTPFTLRAVLRNEAIHRLTVARFAVLGLLGGVIYQSLSYYAAHYTTAINMDIIQALVPLIALVLSMIFLSHNPNYGSILGLAISIMGVILVVSKGDPAVLEKQGLNFGDALMLLGVVAFALYSLLLNRWKSSIPLIQSVYMQAIFATLAFLPFFLLSAKHALIPMAGFYVGFAGVAASIFAPLLWMLGITHLGAVRVSLFFNLVPVITALLAVVCLSEGLTRWVVVGGGLAIFGVVIVETVKIKNLR